MVRRHVWLLAHEFRDACRHRYTASAGESTNDFETLLLLSLNKLEMHMLLHEVLPQYVLSMLKEGAFSTLWIEGCIHFSEKWFVDDLWVNRRTVKNSGHMYHRTMWVPPLQSPLLELPIGTINISSVLISIYYKDD